MTHPQQRERADPHEASRPIPIWVLVLSALLVAWGVVYIVGSGPLHDAALGDTRSLDDLRARQATAGSTPAADGAALYAARCAACHQAHGNGLPGVFPPLAGSEWVIGSERALLQILLHGAQGALTVKGQVFNGAMPAFGAQLNDAELAALSSHIRRQWGNAAAPVQAAAVAREREASAGRSSAWNGDAELGALR